MRDFRNAKAMAKTLREELAERSFPVSHSDSLELVARLLGCKNWQTLAAAIEAETARPAPPEAAPTPALIPVVPMRDLVLFPETAIPLFAGRPKTLRAIERAMAGDRRLLVVTQRRGSDDAPAQADLFEIGVVAQILQTQRLADGNLKLLVQAERRVRLVRLEDGELLQAEIEPVVIQPPDEAAQAMAREAFERFVAFARIDAAAPPLAMARIPYMAGHPGPFADLIAPHVVTRLEQAQDLLATADPAERLKKLMAVMEGRKEAA